MNDKAARVEKRARHFLPAPDSECVSTEDTVENTIQNPMENSMENLIENRLKIRFEIRLKSP